MIMRHARWSALALVVAGNCHADELRYHAQGSLVPFGTGLGTYAYMEVWGAGNNAAVYANPATDAGDAFHPLIADAEAISATALGGYTDAGVNFGYDPSASPFGYSATGRTAFYAIAPMSMQMTGLGAAALALSASDTELGVGRSVSGHTQTLYFERSTLTVEGPLPGSTFSYSAPPAPELKADIVSLVGPMAYYSVGFDLSAFATLPVRLTAPTQFKPVLFAVLLGRNDPGATFTNALPPALQLSDYGLYSEIDVYFDGIYAVTVDRSDYASNESWLAASSWVDQNIRQIDFEQEVAYQIAALEPVPEPVSTWLFLVGLTSIVQFGHRHRMRRPHST